MTAHSKDDGMEAARRIIAKHEQPIRRPTIDELEAILAQPDAVPVSINPDGSIGIGESDALIVARALLSSSAAASGVVEALMDSEFHAGTRAGWDAAHADNPREAFAALDKTRAERLRILSSSRSAGGSEVATRADDGPTAPTDHL